ncbi:uncharacterized protein DKFZp434B061 [Hyalella azteca]|uniref:Beta-1,4-N-acetylgalactosaminyltransferase n=1 Tax=Hyalella azteca TaxID=294128 RepID=A0A8B7NZV1_HYAAZ|nr:uncharacterized protein DKFZp434B061 [Hyalella azteca]
MIRIAGADVPFRKRLPAEGAKGSTAGCSRCSASCCTWSCRLCRHCFGGVHVRRSRILLLLLLLVVFYATTAPLYSVEPSSTAPVITSEQSLTKERDSHRSSEKISPPPSSETLGDASARLEGGKNNSDRTIYTQMTGINDIKMGHSVNNSGSSITEGDLDKTSNNKSGHVAGEEPNLSSVSGEPNLSSLSGEPNLSSVSREPNLSSVSGEPNLSSVSGEPNLSSVSGEPNLSSVSGEPNLSSVSGEPNLSSVSGEPNLSLVSGEPNLSSVSGEPNLSSVSAEPLTCPTVPPNLGGPVAVNTSSADLAEVERRHPELLPGGRWRPEECQARQKVAIIIPYRL